MSREDIIGEYRYLMESDELTDEQVDCIMNALYDDGGATLLRTMEVVESPTPELVERVSALAASCGVNLADLAS